MAPVGVFVRSDTYLLKTMAFRSTQIGTAQAHDNSGAVVFFLYLACDCALLQEKVWATATSCGHFSEEDPHCVQMRICAICCPRYA